MIEDLKLGLCYNSPPWSIGPIENSVRDSMDLDYFYIDQLGRFPAMALKLYYVEFYSNEFR